MKLRCIVIDDEYPARVLLNDYIKNLPQLELVKSFKNPMEAMEVLNSEGTDLVFLDIQMPGLTGIEFLKTLRIKPMIIFTTAYPEYALEGYSLDVVDYLLKPITFERFVKAVNKASELFQLRNHGGSKSPQTGLEKERSQEDFLQIKSGTKTYKVKISDIYYIEGLREYVTYVLTSQKIISLESLRNLEMVLPANFIRVHKSFIINKDKVEVLEGNQLEIKGKKIPIGKSYKEQVAKRIFK